MSFFKKFSMQPEKPGCIMFLFPKKIPEKIIYFHKNILQEQNGLDYYIIDLHSYDIDNLFLQASITFLGTPVIYGIKDADISVAQRKKLNAFFNNYAGPHYIYFFTHEVSYEKNAIICDTAITKNDIQDMLVHSKSSTVAPSFIERLYMQRSVYSFDEFFIIMRYAHLLGSRHEIFFSQWLARLLRDDASLFELSQYFFAQKHDALILEWNRLKNQYPSEFWIAFFSEQLWQAALFIAYSKQGKARDARKYSYRLPFSFFQKDYKKYTAEKITGAHQLLYEIDYILKNGCASDGIDLFIQSAFL